MPRRVTSAAEKNRLNAARQRAFRLRRVQSIEQAQLDAQLNVFRPRSPPLPSSPSSKPSSFVPTPNASPIKPHLSVLGIEEHPFFHHLQPTTVTSPRSSRSHVPGPSQNETYFSGLPNLPTQVADIDEDINIDDAHVTDSHKTADINAFEHFTESSDWIGEAIDRYEKSSVIRQQAIRQQQEETNLRLEQWAKELPTVDSSFISSPIDTRDAFLTTVFPKIIIPIPILSNSDKYLEYPDNHDNDAKNTNNNTNVEYATYNTNDDNNIYHTIDESDDNDTKHVTDISASSKYSKLTILKVPSTHRPSVRHPSRFLAEYEGDFEDNVRLAQRVLKRSWAPECHCG